MRKRDYRDCDLIGILNSFTCGLNYSFNWEDEECTVNYFSSLKKHFGDYHLEALRKTDQWIKDSFCSPHSKQFYIFLPNPKPQNKMIHVLVNFLGNTP